VYIYRYTRTSYHWIRHSIICRCTFVYTHTYQRFFHEASPRHPSVCIDTSVYIYTHVMLSIIYIQRDVVEKPPRYIYIQIYTHLCIYTHTRCVIHSVIVLFQDVQVYIHIWISAFPLDIPLSLCVYIPLCIYTHTLCYEFSHSIVSRCISAHIHIILSAFPHALHHDISLNIYTHTRHVIDLRMVLFERVHMCVYIYLDISVFSHEALDISVFSHEYIYICTYKHKYICV